MHDYLNLAYLDDMVKDEMLGREITERQRVAIEHVVSLYYPLFLVTKSIDKFFRGEITESEFFAAYNKFRAVSGCALKD